MVAVTSLAAASVGYLLPSKAINMLEKSIFPVKILNTNLLDELKADTGKTYLLVAHNGIARVVQSYFYDMTNEEYAAAGIKNCELVEYHFE